jgi:predicted ATP-dependent serine protease
VGVYKLRSRNYECKKCGRRTYKHYEKCLKCGEKNTLVMRKEDV